MTTEQKLWLWGRTLLRAFGPVLLYVVMPGTCMAIGYILTRPDMNAQEFFIYGSNFYTAVGMGLTLWIFSRSCRRRGITLNEELGYLPEQIDWEKAGCFLGFGAATALALSAALTLFPVRVLLASYTEASGRMYKGGDLLFAIGMTAFLGPVLEEVVFRGFFLNRLLEGFREKEAVYLVSAFFAAAHGQVVWIAYAFVMGLFMARLSMREDGIFYPICVHMGFNLPSVLICIIQRSEAASQAIFGNRLLVFLYGAAAAAAARLCWLRLKKLRVLP